MHILEKYPELLPYKADTDLRTERYLAKRTQLLTEHATLKEFANAHKYYGFHRKDGGWVYREWAPAADALYLTGDFNNWHWTETPMRRLENGNWELFLPGDTLQKGSRVMTIVDNGGSLTQHIPLYARRVTQDWQTQSWCCEVWEDEAYPWTDEGFSCSAPPLIYEVHIGMSCEDGRIATYREFADKVLPHVWDAGYNTIQLMAIMEHPFYGSFGYQVSSFFAPTSRFGYPEELKYLVNKAHAMGIRVLLDVVHSHAVKNTLEGINRFDGTDHQFFHAGPEGDHPAWGTKLFNYDKPEVLHFLLSNLKYWMEEYHFDGFRFDGVTSMLYHDHGLGTAFTDLRMYFSVNTDTQAVTYLQLANELVKQIDPHAITIAEDMSGMPGMCE
ncbi:MAG: 1,4-alpha-glucan-branching enzyme, partial [Oscillospiraceae bacterium]|nr:1,4-alpha-glucan-branching enzyme [Oscillospiraceae bacterium]